MNQSQQFQSDEELEEKQKAQAKLMEEEIEALIAEMNQKLPSMEKNAAENEAKVMRSTEALSQHAESIDSELGAAEADAQKHMEIVDEE